MLLIAGTELLAVGGVQDGIEWISGWHPNTRWPTISTTVGHLGEQWGAVYYTVVAVIAAVVFHGFAYRYRKEETAPDPATPAEGSERQPFPYYPWWFAFLLVAAVAVPAVLLAEHKLTRGYWIYGSFLIFGVIIPSVIVVILKKDPFPTFFSTFRSLQQRRLWPWIAPVLIGLLAGLVFHLALYPWPNITNEPSRYAGLKAASAKKRAQRVIDDLDARSRLTYSAQFKGIAVIDEQAKKAWLVYFSPPKGSGVKYSNCVVVVSNETEAFPLPESQC